MYSKYVSASMHVSYQMMNILLWALLEVAFPFPMLLDPVNNLWFAEEV